MPWPGKNVTWKADKEYSMESDRNVACGNFGTKSQKSSAFLHVITIKEYISQHKHFINKFRYY